MELRRLFLRGMLWSLGFAAATGVLALLFSGGDIVWRIVGTGAVTAVACVLMIPASGLMDRRASRIAGLFGMTAIVAEYLLVLALVWALGNTLLPPGQEESFLLRPYSSA